MAQNLTPKPGERAFQIAMACLLLPAILVAAPTKRTAKPERSAKPLANPLIAPTNALSLNTNLSTLPAPGVKTLPDPRDPEFEFGGPLRRANPNMAPEPKAESTNIPAATVAAPAPEAPDSPPSDSDWITPDDLPSAPVAVRIIPPPDSVMVPGIFVRHMKVEIKNRSKDHVAAIRDVRWVNGLRRSDWVKSLSGKSRVTSAGLIVVERGPNASEIGFEHGLLLPGESLKLTLPLTPQSPGIHTLEVAFVTVGGPGRPWRDEVLIPASKGAATEIFDVPLDRLIQARAGQGGIGLLRCALQKNLSPQEVTRLAYRFGLPMAKGVWLSQLTAGLSAEQALARAEIPPDAGHLAYFIEPLPAWVLIRPTDGDSRTLLKEGETWSLLRGSKIDAAAPDLMCSAPDHSTPALLDPNNFSDIVAVQTPWLGQLYNPGKTYLDPPSLRLVLRRAGERSIPIHVATIDPNGLGLEEILTLGVKVDASGRWLHPSIAPTSPKDPGSTAITDPRTPGARPIARTQ